MLLLSFGREAWVFPFGAANSLKKSFLRQFLVLPGMDSLSNPEKK